MNNDESASNQMQKYKTKKPDAPLASTTVFNGPSLEKVGGYNLTEHSVNIRVKYNNAPGNNHARQSSSIEDESSDSPSNNTT